MRAIFAKLKLIIKLTVDPTWAKRITSLLKLTYGQLELLEIEKSLEASNTRTEFRDILGTIEIISNDCDKMNLSLLIWD